MYIKNWAALVLVIVLFSACAVIRIQPEAEPVRLTFDIEEVRCCKYIGEVVGSEGSWYDAWIISNEVLTTAALNDLRNKAHAKGTNTVFVPGNTLLFSTSVTILGQAYQCKNDHGGPREVQASHPGKTR